MSNGGLMPCESMAARAQHSLMLACQVNGRAGAPVEALHQLRLVDAPDKRDRLAKVVDVRQARILAARVHWYLQAHDGHLRAPYPHPQTGLAMAATQH